MANRVRLVAGGVLLAVVTAFAGGRLRRRPAAPGAAAPPAIEPGAARGRRPASSLTPSENALAFIRKAEGLRLYPYPDADGCSIGYGHRIKGGSCLTAPFGFQNGITKEEAEDLLVRDAGAVADVLRARVRVPLTQNEFDALVSLAYNIGGPRFGGSTLLRKLNAGDYAGAAREFDVWRMSEGRVHPGLVARRAEERRLFEA